MPRDFRARLDDILEAAQRIEQYIANLSLHEFQSDRKSTDAVVRNLEIIGEAVKGLPPEIRQRRPHVPWTRIASLRDFPIHEYFGVDTEILWEIATAKVPELKAEIQSLLSELDAPDSNSSASP